MRATLKSSFWILMFMLLISAVVLTGAKADAAEGKAVEAQPEKTQTEDFKGEPPAHQFTAGGMVGLGILDPNAGFTILATGARKFVHKGFAPEINNQVFGEIAVGPLFVAGTTAFIYSVHIRWDFPMNDQWTFFAIGGLGGNITGSSLGNRWGLFPRFGLGTFLKLNKQLSLRGEVSHEWIATGVSFAL